MPQWLQLTAGFFVVLAFALLQVQRINPFRMPYLLMNFGGTGLLAIAAIESSQYGFLLTNGTWAVVSAFGIVRRARGVTPVAAAEG